MKLYIETSVPNMLFADDAPEKRAATDVFFDWLRVTNDELFSSEVVKSEIDRAPEPKRTRMIRASSSPSRALGTGCWRAIEGVSAWLSGD